MEIGFLDGRSCADPNACVGVQTSGGAHEPAPAIAAAVASVSLGLLNGPVFVHFTWQVIGSASTP